MLFNSQIFIFVFLPSVLLLWFGLHRAGLHRLAQLALFGMSLWFYGYFNLYYLAILLISICVNYFISFLMELSNAELPFQGFSKSLMLLGVLFNLGILFYFKYYDFFLDNLNHILGVSFSLKNILLPLGISFFTFQQVSFIIDRYRKYAPHYTFLEYAVFVSFFPQLVAGPIVLHRELIPQLKEPEHWHFDKDNFARGACLFVFGLSKKVLVADTIAYVVNYGFDRVYYLDTLSALVTALAYTFELYFDFSGYCDMAIGIGNMFNLTLPENFNSPYKSLSVSEFWRRWHITLGRFFTQYVYIPLGGNRRGFLRRNVNVLVVFALSGLWHGANWTYVLWGLSQGAAIVVENYIYGNGKDKNENNFTGAFGKSTIPEGFTDFFRWLLTFSYTVLAFAMFRSLNVEMGLELLKRIFIPSNTGFIIELTSSLSIPEMYIPSQALSILAPGALPVLYAMGFAVIMILAALLLAGKKSVEFLDQGPYNGFFAAGTAFLFMWSVISLSGASTFLYFNF